MEDTQPMETAAPVAGSNRLGVIDALRGVALLGILLMNMPGFSMPDYSFEAFKNDPTSINFWVFAVIGVFFEGKMRALFGMVFGAGVLLFIANKSSTRKSVHSLFYRRMFWLVLFGLIHAHVILWFGDILYFYGICGMLLYLFRNVKPKFLVLGVPIVAIISFVSGTLFYQNIRAQRIAYVEATAARSANQTLTEAQTKALEDWREIEKSMIPSRADADANTEKMRSDYWTVAERLRPLTIKFETVFVPMMIWDSLALMLLGMALFKWGFLTGDWENADYWKVLKIGYGVGLPLVIYATYYSFQNYTTLEANLARMERVPINWIDIIYPFQRILLVMAHTALLILLYKSGKIQGLFRRLEAVGQMAFTNYISHSVICTLFFFGYGLGYYGHLQYYQTYILALAIWALQLIVSPLWLKHFRFGPLEWLWRTLTYWKIQPIRKEA